MNVSKRQNSRSLRKIKPLPRIITFLRISIKPASKTVRPRSLGRLILRIVVRSAAIILAKALWNCMITFTGLSLVPNPSTKKSENDYELIHLSMHDLFMLVYIVSIYLIWLNLMKIIYLS